MTALPPSGASNALQTWRTEGKMPGFFRWLAELGRKDEEVREVEISAHERETTWDRSIYDGPPIRRTFMTIGYNVTVTFADKSIYHRYFNKVSDVIL